MLKVANLRVPARSQPSARLELWQWALVATAAAAFACKIVLALKTYGTNDVYSFEQLLEWWRYLGTDLFRVSPGANNPPSMLYMVAFLRWMAQSTGMAFSFWFHVPAILADLGNLWLVYRLLESRWGERAIRWALIVMAAAPALILISGYHGQNDSVMIFFLLLSVYFVEKGRTVAGGAAFGLSMCIKVAPIIAIPALVFYQFGRKKWLLFLTAAGAVLLFAWSPFILRDPRAVLTDCFGYKSGLGHWGISYLAYQLSLISPVGASLCALIEKLGSPLLLLTIAALSWWMNRSTNRPSLYSQLGLIFFVFLAGTAGFGVQYLAWLVPFAVGLGAGPAALFCATSGVFLFLVYDFWSQGMPWFLADSIRVGDYYFAGVGYFQIVCWLSVAALAWTSWRQMQGRCHWEESFAHITQTRRCLVLSLASLLLVVPMAAWLSSQPATWRANRPRGAAALSVARQWYMQDLSTQLQRMGRVEASVEVAKRNLSGAGK